MNPNAYQRLSMGWGIPAGDPRFFERVASDLRRAELHKKAVTRRQKAKRGGKR